MGAYAQAFAENEVDAEVLPSLTADDLRDLGVSLVGHRRKLLDAIATLQRDGAHAVQGGGSRESKDHGPPRVDAERRHLTLMFCDLVGSTTLSARLDPEDWREVLQKYLDVSTAAIRRFNGFVAKYQGDGILAYFGYPQAHEDDVERAVRAALDVVTEVKGLKGTVGGKTNVELSVRIGVATGLVVVGDMIGEEASERSAVVGETPNLAARLQAVAEPDSVVISPSTHELAGAVFEYDDIGEHDLAGIDGPVRVWKVLREALAASRFDVTRGSTLTPLIGREEELSILTGRWGMTKSGEGQVVLIAGEAGIGKSRLVQVIRERISTEEHGQLLYQCSQFHINRAFYPITAQLERAASIESSDSTEKKATKLETLLGQSGSNSQSELPIFAALLSLPGGNRFSDIEPDPEQRKGRVLDALLHYLEALARMNPILCIFEDVHWIDASTMEFLSKIVERIQDMPVFVILTARPEFASPWTGLAHTTLMALSRMNPRSTAQLVASVLDGKLLPDDVLKQIVERTDGIPLFVEELTRTVLGMGLLEAKDDQYILTGPLPPLAIPTTLHDSLMARLDRLSMAREIAQLAAAIGRSFDYAVLADVSALEERALQDGLTELDAAGLVLRHGTPPDATYQFKHALIQEAAYQSLLKTTRMEFHRRIAESFETSFPDVPRTDPGLLAHHYTEAGLLDHAIPYWQSAGERAIETSAFVEGIENFSKGLELLKSLPETTRRVSQEITLGLALGVAQVQALGPASEEVERTYSRALELCDRKDTPEERFKALWGLWFVQFMRGNVPGMQAFADQLSPLAEELGNDALVLESHHVQWAGLSLMGELDMALQHTEEGIARYCVEEHHWLTFVYGGHDPGLCAQNLHAILLCLKGYPDQARRRSTAAVAQAEELGHPYTLLEGLFCGLIVGLLQADLEALERNAGVLNTLARDGKLPAEAAGLANGFLGWAMAEKGQSKDGLELMRNSAETWQSFWGPWCFPLDAAFAAVLCRAGHGDEALHIVDQAVLAVEEGGGHWWDAEFYRVRGEALWRQGQSARNEAEACFVKAMEYAGAQNAMFLKLRAARSLAEHKIDDGEDEQAGALLRPVYDWFTEGFDMPDMVASKALLERLS